MKSTRSVTRTWNEPTPIPFFIFYVGFRFSRLRDPDPGPDLGPPWDLILILLVRTTYIAVQCACAGAKCMCYDVPVCSVTSLIAP